MSETRLSVAAYFLSSGILTGFPFDKLQLGFILGLTNPQQINFTEEPEPLRWLEFSSNNAVTIDKIRILPRSTLSQERASALGRHLSTTLSDSRSRWFI
jgi:hypothetical protein